MKGLFVHEVQIQYEVPNFYDDLKRHFLRRWERRNAEPPFTTMSTWWHVRLQLRDPQDTGVLLPSLTLQASPPMLINGSSNLAKRGNFALVRHNTSAVISNADDLDQYGIQGGSSVDIALSLTAEYNCRIYGCTAEDYIFS